MEDGTTAEKEAQGVCVVTSESLLVILLLVLFLLARLLASIVVSLLLLVASLKPLTMLVLERCYSSGLIR